MLPQKLMATGYTLYSGDLFLPKGGINHNILVVNSQGELFCLRAKKPNAATPIVKMYLDLLYGSMGIYALDGKLSFRTIQEQVDFIQMFQQTSQNALEVIDYDEGWMLTRYVRGKLLKDALQTRFEPDLIFNFLDGLLHAHEHKIALLDRWGGNEIVTPQKQIVFLDFDIQVDFDGLYPLRKAVMLDLAIALRTCFLWSPDKSEVFNQVKTWFVISLARLANVYDFALLTQFLTGGCIFYDLFEEDNLIGLSLSVPAEQHRATSEAVYKLVDWLLYLGKNGQERNYHKTDH